MFNNRGTLRTCLLLLLVGTLTLPWQPAGASRPDPLVVEAIPTADDDLADGVHLRDYLPTGQAAIASSVVSGDQGPHLWRPLKTRLVPHALLQPSEDRTNQPTRSAGTCPVDSTSDSGANTLRQCLLDAVAGDEILFDPSTFPPGTPMTITLASELPYITVDNLTIDASNAGVILDGSALASDSWGLVIAGAQGVTLRGLQIMNFNVGVLLLSGATYTTVGGDRAVGAGPLGQGNLISANRSVGVQVQDAGTAHNSIIGNLIGTDITGDTADGNGYAGVAIAFEASQNVIGGGHSPGTCDGLCNLISGNQVVGVQIDGAGTEGNQVLGNFVGTDLSGHSANGNREGGIIIGFEASQNVIGGSRSPGVCDGHCNLISGNVNVGVVIGDDGTTGNQVLGNFVGTNPSGDAALPNNQGVVIALGASDTQVGGAGAGKGNLISGNTNFGIWISSTGTTGNQVLGNIIGMDITGMTAVPNYDGILISESTDNQIGGAAAGAGNLISGNEYAGIWMEYLAGPGNTIAGNKIGTNLTGTGAVPNYYGVIHVVASNNLIGGTEPGAGNLISGNAQVGLYIERSTLNSVLGNTIGADLTGEVAIPNVVWGIFIGFGASNNTIGGSAPGSGNLISGNGLSGVHVQDEDSVGNRILGNRIGTNRAGSSSLPNDDGVVVILARETIIGGADTSSPWVCDGPCNLISGNGGFGVTIQGVGAGTQQQTRPGRTDRLVVADQDNQVLGNFIGTDLTGASALPNLAGVRLSYEATGNLIGGSSLLGEGNLIGGNQRDGIVVSDPLTANNQISGNRIGTTADGGSGLPNGENGVWIYGGASGNTVGGEGLGLGNLISGQATDPLYFGVYISTESEPEAIDNQVIGNLIGTNGAGTSAIPNGGGVGVANLVTGTVIRDNVISGNSLRGILILEATGSQVRDNDIGVAADGLSPLPNDVFGIILVTAPHNIIGPGNTIAYNAAGVAIGYPESVGNTITQNSIYANTKEQIDFFEVAQPLAPAPNLTGWDGETVSGTACAGCQVEVFANPGPQPAGHTYLGTTTAAGDGTFSLTVGPGYRYLAATATDAEGTTSELSTSLFIGTISNVYLPLTVKATGPLH
jgi:titin